MKYFFFIILFVLFCLGFNNCSCSEKKDKILIVADEWPQMHTMAAGICKTHEYLIDSVSQEEIPSALSEYDCIFIYVHKVFLKKAEQALFEYTNNGGKLIVLHHGIASAKIKNPEWMEFVGVEIKRSKNEMIGWKVLEDTTFTMVNLSPGHYITSNKIIYSKRVNFTTNYTDSISGNYKAFDLKNTEIFLNQRFTDIRKKKLLYGFSTENGTIMQPTAGWYERKSKGWLFYFQAGHQIADYENKNFIQILRNTIEWNPEL